MIGTNLDENKAATKYACVHQCFFLQNEIKCFMDTLIQKIIFQIMKINNFQGDLTNILAIKEALVCTCSLVKGDSDLAKHTTGSLNDRSDLANQFHRQGHFW